MANLLAALPLPKVGDAYRRFPYVEHGGGPHRDPFDRLLVAQASAERAPVVTRDPGIAAHGVATVW